MVRLDIVRLVGGALPTCFTLFLIIAPENRYVQTVIDHINWRVNLVRGGAGLIRLILQVVRCLTVPLGICSRLLDSGFLAPLGSNHSR